MRLFTVLAAAAVACLLAVIVIAPPALAQAAGDAPTSVSIPLGAWLSQAADFIGWALAAVVMWALRKLPANIVAILQTLRVEQLLEKAISFGINSVKDAAADKALSIEVGNKVVAEALQYAVDKIPGSLLAWVGGEDKLREMIVARLDVEPAAAIE